MMKSLYEAQEKVLRITIALREHRERLSQLDKEIQSLYEKKYEVQKSERNIEEAIRATKLEYYATRGIRIGAYIKSTNPSDNNLYVITNINTSRDITSDNPSVEASAVMQDRTLSKYISCMHVYWELTTATPEQSLIEPVTKPIVNVKQL